MSDLYAVSAADLARTEAHVQQWLATLPDVGQPAVWTQDSEAAWVERFTAVLARGI